MYMYLKLWKVMGHAMSKHKYIIYTLLNQTKCVTLDSCYQHILHSRLKLARLSAEYSKIGKLRKVSQIEIRAPT